MVSESRMENSSEPSASSCEDASVVVEGDSEGELFVVGKKLLFSLSSISLSAKEFRCLSLEKDKTLECSPREVHEEETECETTTSSKASTSDSEAHTQSHDKSDSQWWGFLRRLKKGPSATLHTFHPSIPSLKKLSRRRSRKSLPSMPALAAPVDTGIGYFFDTSWKNFTLAEIQAATDNFSQENLIGEGGYSEVYKGHLEDGQLVAIKRLTRGGPEEMTADYLSELGMLVHVNHPNIASVIGYGVDGGMHLVLPLSPHGSLASKLKAHDGKLAWSQRYNIALGTALGLAYLHEGCHRRIIHRDIKAANILLTESFEPQIADFGLAKWLPDQWTHLTVSQFEGTFGYLPPEFFMHGIVDEKTDVYAYGVLLLEIISGRPALDEKHNSVVMWAKPLLINRKMEQLLDPALNLVYDAEQLDRMVMVASLCIHQAATERPKMSKVVKMLENGEGIAEMLKEQEATLPQLCDLEDISPMVKDHEGISPMLKDNEGISPMLNDNEGISPILKDNEGISPMLKDNEGISPMLKDNEGISPVLKDNEGISPILKDHESISPVLNDHEGIISPVLNNHEGVISPVLKEREGIILPVMKDHEGIISPVLKDHENIISPVSKDHEDILSPVLESSSPKLKDREGISPLLKDRGSISPIMKKFQRRPGLRRSPVDPLNDENQIVVE